MLTLDENDKKYLSLSYTYESFNGLYANTFLYLYDHQMKIKDQLFFH